MIVNNPHLTIKGGLLWETTMRMSIGLRTRILAILWGQVGASITHACVITLLPKG